MTKDPAILADPAVDGFTVILEWMKQVPRATGERPIHETIAVFVDKDAARDLFTQYKTLVTGPAVSLVWSGIDLSGENFKVSVLRVDPVVVRSLIKSTGGLNPPGLGWLECDWHLIAIST